MQGASSRGEGSGGGAQGAGRKAGLNGWAQDEPGGGAQEVLTSGNSFASNSPLALSNNSVLLLKNTLVLLKTYKYTHDAFFKHGLCSCLE